MITDSRADTRRFFFETWRQMKDGGTLDGVASLVREVILLHPEYHTLLDQGPRLIERNFGGAEPEHNPFLHMGLHIALREQVQADRPAGIAAQYARLLHGAVDPHITEHRMIERLATELWQAQTAGRLPDEQAYLAALERL